MTPQEMSAMVETNKPERWGTALLMYVRDQWILCVGETQSDGVFRHVDLEIDDAPDAMLKHLAGMDPANRAVFDKRIAEIKGERVQ